MIATLADRHLWPAHLLVAALLAACVSTSGFGPQNAPDESQAALVRVGFAAFIAADAIGDRPFTLLDHLDPSLVARSNFATDVMEDMTTNELPSAEAMNDATKAAIRDLVGNENVRWLPIWPAPAVGDSNGCGAFAGDGSLLKLALVRARSVHGGAFWLVAESPTYCGMGWTAVHLHWEAGNIGGTWVAGPIVSGGELST